jgi:hypothetical protein
LTPRRSRFKFAPWPGLQRSTEVPIPQTGHLCPVSFFEQPKSRSVQKTKKEARIAPGFHNQVIVIG